MREAIWSGGRPGGSQRGRGEGEGRERTCIPTSTLSAIELYSSRSLTMASKMANNRSKGKAFPPANSGASLLCTKSTPQSISHLQPRHPA